MSGYEEEKHSQGTKPTTLKTYPPKMLLKAENFTSMQ